MKIVPLNLRRYERRDEAAVYEVCLRTGDNGNDATQLYDDPRALGHIYVGPYLKLEPGWPSLQRTARACAATCWERWTQRDSMICM